MGRITPGKPLKGIPAQDWNRFCETADRVLSAPPGGSSQGPGRVPGSLRVMVKNTTGTPIDAHGVLKLGDPLINPTDRAGVVLEEPVFAGTTPSSSDDLHDIAIVPACDAGGFAKAFVEGYTWATVNVTDDAHEFAKPQASVVQLLSDADEGFPIKWKPSGTGSKKCLIRMMTSAEPGETKVAKLVKIDGLKPMYETENTGTYTYTTPSIPDAPSYSRDSGTGDLTLGTDENVIVNIAQRNWDGGSPRGRLALAVPIDGNVYVPVPMAADPFMPAVSLEYSEGLVLDVDDSIWIMSDEFTMRTFGKAVAADADDWFPLFARPTSRGLFLLKPGKYLYQARCNWTFYVSGTVGDPDQFDSGPASAGTAHTHEIDRDPRGIVSFGFRVFDIDASAPGAATPSNGAGRFACCDFSQGYWWSHQCQPVLTLCGIIDVPASGKPKRINLCASFHAYHYDSIVANQPQIKLEGAEIQVIPVSGYLQDDGLSTADQHMDMYNPWESGSYVWHQGYSNPPNWDRDGA